MNTISTAEFFQLYKVILQDSGLATFFEEGNYRRVELHEVTMGCSFKAIQEQTEPPAFSIAIATSEFAWLEIQNPKGSLIITILYRQAPEVSLLKELYQQIHDFHLRCSYNTVTKKFSDTVFEIPLLSTPVDSYVYYSSDTISLPQLIKDYREQKYNFPVLKQLDAIKRQNAGVSYLTSTNTLINFVIRASEKIIDTSSIAVNDFQTVLDDVNDRLPLRHQKITDSI